MRRKILLMTFLVAIIGFCGTSLSAQVAKVGDNGYASVIAAIQAAIEQKVSEVTLLENSSEVMPTDVEFLLKADLKITANSPVTAEFYNNGTSYDFIFNSYENGGHTLTIGENVTFNLKDRIIWAGYYGDNITVVVEGTLIGGYQYWCGAKTKVTETGTLKSAGEALVLRRGTTLEVDGGKIEANYFSFLSGKVIAKNNATITSGPIWVANEGSYINEGNVELTLDNSTWTSSGNIKLESTHDNGVVLNVKNGAKLSASSKEYGANVIGSSAVVNVDNAVLNVGTQVTNNGEINATNGAIISTPKDVTIGGTVNVDEYSSILPQGTVAKIGTQSFETFAAALTAANNMTGDVTVEIYEKVTLNSSLSGNYSSINFVGKDTDAEIYLDVQGYIEAIGKNVTFTDLTLSKSTGGFITNAGFMNVAFGVYNVDKVTYNNCTFANGACASSGVVTYNKCTFKRSHDKYGLWAYGDVETIVGDCIFADYRGIKMYAEGAAKTVDLTVKNTDFRAVTDKPAIVLTYGESVTLEGNTYSGTGTFELDLDGAPNGTTVTSDVAPTCKNDNGACGVLVDGKIYTTVAQAAAVATSGSTVTLLHNSTETVELQEGVILDKNGYEAAGVTVVQPVASVNGNTYASLQEAISNAKAGDEIVLLGDVTDVDVTINKKVTLDLNGNTIFDAYIKIASDVTVKNGSIKNVNESYPLVVNSGTLTVEGVAIEASKSDRAIWLNNSGTILNFNEGSSILATKGESNTKSKIYGVWVCQGATANINGGSITVDAGSNATAVAIFGNYVNTVNVNGGKISTSGNTYSYAIWTDGDITVAGGEIITNEKQYGYSSGITYGKNYAINTKGNVEISGGKFTTYGPSGYIVNAGGSNQEVKISGGEFTNVLSEADKTAGGHSEPNLFYGSSVVATITDGDFEGYSATLIKGTNSTLTVSGGTFDRKINDEYLAEGFEISENEDGTFGVAEDLTYGKVAKVGETYYTDLQDAIVAAAPSGTVEIINDITVDKWIMISERLSIGTGQLITIEKIDGLTINGNNHSLTINSIESASNGNRLFYDATELNIKDLTINYAEGVTGGIGLTSGIINNVTFNGGVGVLPGTGNITISGCTFNTSGSAIYNEEDRDNLVVTGNTFNTAEGQYAIYLRGNTTFTDNTVITGKVNVTNSGTGLISGNDFGTERFKVYNAATATIENNKINVLTFNDESEVASTFGINTLSEEAQAVLDASISYVTLEYFVQEVIEGNGTYNGNNITVKVVPASGDTGTDSDVNIPNRLQKYSNPEVYYAQYQRFGDLTDVNVSNVNFVFVPKAVTVVDAWNKSGASTTAENINGELQLMNNGIVSFTNCSFKKMSVSPISAATLSVTLCKFNGLNAYAIKDVKANTTITGTTFTDCNGGFWFSNAPANITVTGNTFTGVGRRGAIQFSATGDYTNTAMNITGNKVTDEAAFLWQLNPTVSNAQLSAILNNNEYTTAFVAGSIEPSLQGDGSETNPYLINNVDDLVLFRDMVNTYSSDGSNQFRGKFVKLTNDIDLEGINWTPIGSINVDHGFMGNFDGGTYKIKNLTITNPSLDSDGYAYAGFFGITEGTDKDNQNVIKNLTIENVTINTTGHIVSAAIAYPYYTIVDNVKVCGDIKINGGDYTAGVLAYTRRCVNASDLSVVGNTGSFVKGNQVVGGVISDIQMNGGLVADYKNFSAEGIAVEGTKSVGAISGIISGQNLDNATVKNVELNSKDGCAGIVAGRLGVASTVTNVSYENVTGAATLIGGGYDSAKAVQAKIGDTYYATLEAALATQGEATVELLAPVTVATGETRVLNLNGKTVVATDNATGSYAMITNKGDLTINGEGAIRLTATNNRGWNAYSSVISNTVGGKLTVVSGTIEHLGGTDMAYGIDNLTNGKGTYAETVINGGYIKSTYRGVRQFLNGVEAQNILTVNGGTIEGANKSIWMQDPSKNANTGTLTVGEDANLIGDVYLFVTAGSTEWPVEISIAAAALAEGSTVLTGNVPAGYDVQLENGVYGVKRGVAKIDNVLYSSLAEAVSAAAEDATIQLLWQEGQPPIAMNASLYGKNITITGTATVDWSKDFLFVGRGGEGNATLTFDNAKLTSASNSASYGIHVSGREKNTNNKYDGTVIIKNSTIELDYLINKGAITLDNSTLTVKNGFSIGGRPAKETESGVDATATISLNNDSKVIVNNHNGMGLGYEAIGVMNIDATSTFETTQAFLITAKGTLNNAGTVSINGTLTNNGTINFTAETATLKAQEGLTVNLVFENSSAYKVVYENNTYSVVLIPVQEQHLVAGWNWYSSYLNITLNDLTDALGDNGSYIKNFKGNYVENIGDNTWLGDNKLTTISPSEMYLVQTIAECDLKLAAELVNPSEHPINLNAEWSWIGYPSNQGVNINIALENLDANPGDIIKSLNDGYAEYAFGQWLGTLNTMVPGVGYKYNNKSGEAKTFYYNIEATRGAVEANITAENNYWTPNATKYPFNMTMTAVVEGLTNGNYEVAAFVNGEVRGSARPIYVETLDVHIFFLTIHGEDVEEMSFRLYDIDTDTEYALSDRINYSNDAHLGSVSKPYVFSRGTTGIGEAALSEINIYPNPTTTGSTIRLQNTCDRVEVYNALGVLVAEYHNVDSIDALETAGIYVIRVTNDGNTQNCRLVVK